MRARALRARIPLESLRVNPKYNKTCEEFLDSVSMALLEVPCSSHPDFSGILTYHKRCEPKAIPRNRLALLVLSILMFGASAAILSRAWAAILDPEAPQEADITFIVYPNGNFEMRARARVHIPIASVKLKQAP